MIGHILDKNQFFLLFRVYILKNKYSSVLFTSDKYNFTSPMFILENPIDKKIEPTLRLRTTSQKTKTF